jgi:putative flippase GtrA
LHCQIPFLIMRLLKYFFVGGFAAAIDISIFTIFAVYFQWPWLPVSVASFILATCVNYILSINFVFISGIRYEKHVEIAGVFIVSGLALIINQAVLYIAIEWLHIQLIFSKILATGIVFFWNYLGRKKFIF